VDGNLRADWLDCCWKRSAGADSGAKADIPEPPLSATTRREQSQQI